MATTFTVGSQTIPANRIFCVGKNYREHIKELEGDVPDQPVIFMKPVSCLVPAGEKIHLPLHGASLHHEVELVILIGRGGKHIAEAEALSHVAGVTLGLDLTLRDVQSALKKKGHPWELSKAFDESAPIGIFVPMEKLEDIASVAFTCEVNGVLRQAGHSGGMIFPVARIIHFLSGIWKLQPGDLIFTGTPAGVGELHGGDRVTISSVPIGEFSWEISSSAPLDPV